MGRAGSVSVPDQITMSIPLGGREQKELLIKADDVHDVVVTAIPREVKERGSVKQNGFDPVSVTTPSSGGDVQGSDAPPPTVGIRTAKVGSKFQFSKKLDTKGGKLGSGPSINKRPKPPTLNTAALKTQGMDSEDKQQQQQKQQDTSERMAMFRDAMEK